MRYLIDTHVFLWFVSDAKNLSRTAKTLIEDSQNEIFISIASLWEIINQNQTLNSYQIRSILYESKAASELKIGKFSKMDCAIIKRSNGSLW